MVYENPDEQLLDLLRRISLRLEGRVERVIRRDGLTLPQYQLLLAAAEHEDRAIGNFANRVGCGRGNLTGIADRLESSGWARRERCGDDRRIVRLRMTAKGAQIRSIQARVAGKMARWARGVPTSEIEALGRLMTKAYLTLSKTS